MIALPKRGLVAALLSALVAGCQVVPDRGPVETTPRPVEQPAERPDFSALPTDEGRHRIALLVPLSGPNAAVGQSLANATTMALLDAGADTLRITTYDTHQGAEAVASRAVADGNRLILGPLLRHEVAPVLARARPAGVPLITFSNDTGIAQPDVFVVGHAPEQSIARTVQFALGRGARRFAALVPEGEYGDRALAALRSALQRRGDSPLAGAERFSRGDRSVIGAATRLRERGGFDTVLIADGARIATLAAPVLRAPGAALPLLIGTELWSGEAGLAANPPMHGAWFAAVSDYRYATFETSYRARFGEPPYRIATIGYDAILWTLRVARDWQPGTPFPSGRLLNPAGFVGLDGLVRFDSGGTGERALEVREVTPEGIVVVDAAPARF